MSAASPTNVGEREAQAWAYEQELNSVQMVSVISDMREQLDDQRKRAADARAEWDAESAKAARLADRIEALKHRLVSEL